MFINRLFTVQHIYEHLCNVHDVSLMFAYKRTFSVIGLLNHSFIKPTYTHHISQQIVLANGNYSIGWAHLNPGDKGTTAMSVFFSTGVKYQLTELHPATVYVIRVASRNIAGLSDHSVQVMKKTTPQSQTGTYVDSSGWCPKSNLLTTILTLVLIRQLASK